MPPPALKSAVRNDLIDTRVCAIAHMLVHGCAASTALHQIDSHLIFDQK